MSSIPSPYRQLAIEIREGRKQAGIEETQSLIEAGEDLVVIFERGIVPCLEDIGERFSRLELYLPDMMRAAEVVKAIHTEFSDTLQAAGDLHSRGRIVIGTAYGDIHDLGKNIVTSMLEVNGFEVHDIGVDVDPIEFITQGRQFDAHIIAVSSLLSTSMPYVEDVVQTVRANPDDQARFKVLIGGGPVSQDFAREIHADAYGDDAADAVQQAKALMFALKGSDPQREGNPGTNA